MKTMILATAAVLGLGVSAAFADSEGARLRSHGSPSSLAWLSRRRCRARPPPRQRRMVRCMSILLYAVEPRHLAVREQPRG